MGYTRLAKKPDTINFNPNMIRTLAPKSMTVLTETGLNSAIISIITAIIPMIMVVRI
jgi:hypothetical protein